MWPGEQKADNSYLLCVSFCVDLLLFDIFPPWPLRFSLSLAFTTAQRSEVKKWSESHSVVSESLQPIDYIVHGILQARILEWVAFPFSRGSSQPRDRTQVSQIAGGFLPAEPQEKPKKTGVVAYFFSSGSSGPRNWTGVSALQSDSLPTELSGKPT